MPSLLGRPVRVVQRCETKGFLGLDPRLHLCQHRGYDHQGVRFLVRPGPITEVHQSANTLRPRTEQWHLSVYTLT